MAINSIQKAYFMLLICVITSCNSNKKRPIIGDTPYQIEQNNLFKDASKSPLKKRDLKTFKGLDFFEVDSTFITTAKFTKSNKDSTFTLPTTTDELQLYKEYGVLKFNLKGKPFELTVFQNQDNLKNNVYTDYLFLPFTDNTTGNLSYVGGRYLDIKTTSITKNNTVILNFNNTYNPYCAYNSKYSCPLTPRKNHLDIKITAGIKDYKK